MLGDSNTVRRLAVNKINFLRGRLVDYPIPNENFVRGHRFNDASKDDRNDIRRFCLPKTNLYVLFIVNLNGQDTVKPPSIRIFTDPEIKLETLL